MTGAGCRQFDRLLEPKRPIIECHTGSAATYMRTHSRELVALAPDRAGG
jgi:hypothetical protein